MVFNTATVGAAVTPAVLQTFISHYINRKPLTQKPTAHISYDEGLHLIRKFLLYASHHTVEEVQRFTSQWVPHPRWVKVDEVKIQQEFITTAAEAIQQELGHHGIARVGGKMWWQWRKSETRYRLAPQFPFPCGLHDCLSAYLYLLSVQEPSTIILAGDSAGGGMVVSMLVILRDRGLPLPAGAVLISPWVDLTHSFPSVAGDSPLDYIPPHGFHQRPSAAWPPPNSDDMLALERGIVEKMAHKDHTTHPQVNEEDAVKGFHVDHEPPQGMENGTASNDGHLHTAPTANSVPGPGRNLSIMLDGELVQIKDQIQMYASNQLISHPLVSPILQPSLGGLPPLLILTGGAEMLKDEQIYLAHKAANPTKYPAGDAFLDEYPQDHARDQVNKYKPTDVQLQVWDDLCHVAPTLSFTRPAKYMYRSIAQFGAWALARAQGTEIDILDDDDVSIISNSSTDNEDDAAADEASTVVIMQPATTDNSQVAEPSKASSPSLSTLQVGKAGDPLPPFKNHMIRQRVDRHGNIYPLVAASQLPACTISPSEIGAIKEGPVRKWMAAKKHWDVKFASSKRRVQKQREREMEMGYLQFGDGEVPPPSALAGRRRDGDEGKERKRKQRSIGLSLWALWGSKHDEKTIGLEKEADRVDVEAVVPSQGEGTNEEVEGPKHLGGGARQEGSRSRSRRRTVTDEHQTDERNGDKDDETSPLSLVKPPRSEHEDGPDSTALHNHPPVPQIVVHHPTTDDLKRPKAGGIAYPFTLKMKEASASMTTLTSEAGVQPVEPVGGVEAGVGEDEEGEGKGIEGKLGVDGSCCSDNLGDGYTG